MTRTGHTVRGLAEPLSSARPAAGLSAGPLILVLVAPALIALGALELPEVEARAATRLVVLACGLAAIAAAPARAALAHLTAERLREGDSGSLAPPFASLLLVSVAFGAAAGAVAAALAGEGAWAQEGVLAASIGALFAAALLAAEGVTSGGDRDTAAAAVWVGAAAAGGLAALGARLGGLDGALVGGAAGLSLSASVLVGRFLGAGRHAVVALDPAALARPLRGAAAGAAALAFTALLVAAPWAGDLGGALGWTGGSAQGGLAAAGWLEVLGRGEAAAIALAFAPALLFIHVTEEAAVGRAHRALAAEIERGRALFAVERAGLAARRATARAAVRALVLGLTVAWTAGALAPSFAGPEAVARIRAGLAAYGALAAALPPLWGLLHLGRDRLALAALSPALATPGLAAAGLGAAAFPAALALVAAAAGGLYARAARRAGTDLVIADALARARGAPGA